MRTLFGVIAIVALAWAATAGAASSLGARPVHRDAPSDLPPAQIALQHAAAYFAPGRADPRLVRAAKRDPRGGTMALRDLAATVGQLSGPDRRWAEAILARPTDTGSGNYTAARTSFRHICPANFCIHWVVSSRDAPSLTDRAPKNRIPDWIDKVKSVMTNVWNKEVTTYGYKKPKADPPFGGHRGGNPNAKLDVFIQDVGRFGLYGFCTTDDPRRKLRRDVSSYCVLDDDYASTQFSGARGLAALKVTAAHEFHHASQFAYDWKEDRALMEATATNMEADVYGTIHDNYQYFAESPLRPLNDGSDGPWWPVDMFRDFGNQYGDWIFYRFLEEYFGATLAGHPSATRDLAINREIWNQAKAVVGTNDGGKYSSQAVTAAIAARTVPGEALPATFRDAFATFGWVNAVPSAWYKDGALYPEAGRIDRGLFGPGDSDSADWPMYHFSNDYVLFRPDTGATTIDFTLDFPLTADGSNATILVLGTDNSVTVRSAGLGANGDATVTGIPFDPPTVAGVILVITNDSVQMTNCNSHSLAEQMTFACRGDAVDDFLPGGFGYSASIN